MHLLHAANTGISERHRDYLQDAAISDTVLDILSWEGGASGKIADSLDIFGD